MVRLTASLALIALTACTERHVCPLGARFSDCCPDETVGAAEDDLGTTAGEAFAAWRDLTFEATTDAGDPATVSVHLVRLDTRSQGFQPAGDPAPAGTPLEEACDVGLQFEVRGTVTVGDSVFRGLLGWLDVQDDVRLMLVGTEPCGCDLFVEALLEPADDEAPWGRFQARCTDAAACAQRDEWAAFDDTRAYAW